MKTLAIVGSLYVLSGLWCLLNPSIAGSFVGYRMESSMALAEFIAVYGGLQLGFGLGLTLSSTREEFVPGALVVAVVTSWTLFAARAGSFLMFPGVYSDLGVLAMACFELSLAVVLAFSLFRRLSSN